MGNSALTLPAQVVKLADQEEDEAQTSQQRDQAQGAPDISLSGWPVAQ